MQKIPAQAAAAKLNEIMVKKGITPDYKIVDDQCQIGTHINTFVMRVECPIERNGPIFTAEGSGRSKKEAKHQAALAFMQGYDLGDKNNNPTNVFQTRKTPTVGIVNVSDNNRNTVLQTLCLKNDLGNPVYQEIGMRGPPFSGHFTIRCRVRGLSTDGEGTTKSEAKLQATTKMIQVLMQEEEVYEIFESSKSMATAPSRNIICLADNSKVSQSPGRMRIFESGDDSASNMSFKEFDNDCQELKRVKTSNAKSKPLNNLVDSFESSRNSTLAEAINKIKSTLENVENQLYNEILDTLGNRNLPRHRTVTFLSHEFEVFINNETRPEISEGSQKCNDPSIRISALTKLLVDLKNYTEKNCK